MNPRERLLAAYRGEKVDRVPLQLHYAFNIRDREQMESIKDPARREIVERIFEHTTFASGVPSSYVNRYLVTPPQRMKVVERKQDKNKLTVVREIDTPKGKLRAVTSRDNKSHTTWTEKYPVENLDDIAKIKSVPWERPPNLSPLNMEELPPDPDGRRVIYPRISSPFVCVAGMMKYEYFLLLCATELNLMKELTEECKNRILDILDVILSKPGIDVVWMGGCEWLTPPMASPRIYEELVQNQEKEIISRIHESGLIAHVHCHGNVRTTIRSAVERCVNYFDPVEPPPDGDITFAEAKEVVKGKMTLGGNIEARILALEDEEAVENATRAAFEGGKYRMVLQTTEGPLAPLMDKRELNNYHKMIDVWQELSPI